MYKLQTELLSDDTTFSVLAYPAVEHLQSHACWPADLLDSGAVDPTLALPMVCVLFKGPGGLLADKARLAGSVC